jgi:hypothetical protein
LALRSSAGRALPLLLLLLLLLLSSLGSSSSSLAARFRWLRVARMRKARQS